MAKKGDFEGRVIEDMEFKNGILDVESSDARIKAIAQLQAEWRKAALDSQKDIASDDLQELKTDQDWVTNEEDRRYKQKMFQYREKLMAAVGVMQLFERSAAEAASGLQVFSLSRFDQLRENADMVLSLPLNDETNIGLAIQVGNALSADAAKFKAQSFVDNIRAGNFALSNEEVSEKVVDVDAIFKYLEADDLRGIVMPRLEVYIANGSIEKMADAIISSKEAKDLSPKEKEIKTLLRLEIERQLFAMKGALEDFLKSPAEQAKIAKAKDLLVKVSKFHEYFKK